jgi:hypothetical protein
MGFLAKWMRLGCFGASIAYAFGACGGETSGTLFDSDGGAGRGGTSGAAGRGAGGGGTGGESTGTGAGNAGSGGASGTAGAAGNSASGGASGSAGAAGKGGAGGIGGKGGSGGDAGKGGSTGGSRPDGGMFCGGLAGGQCAMDGYCSFKPRDCASPLDVSGVCSPRPLTCTKDCPGVCGCDGKFYCNACLAHFVGVDDTTSTSCMRSMDGGPRGDAGAGEPCKTEDQCQAGLKCCPACPIPGCPIPTRCIATGASGQCPPPPP